MPYNTSHARAFLSQPEMALFESSVGDRLKSLAPAELGRRIARTRTLRAKYRDLLRRQKLKTRERTGSKSGRSGSANERTAKKAAAFDEALKRFEAQAASVKKAAKQISAKKSTASKRATPSNKAATAKKAAPSKKPAPSKKAAVSKKTTSSRKGVPAAKALRDALEKKHAVEAARAAGVAPSRSREARSPSPDTSPGGLRPTPPSVRAAVVASRLQEANLGHIQGHSSTKVRRAQAKRDQRD